MQSKECIDDSVEESDLYSSYENIKQFEIQKGKELSDDI